MKKTLFANKYEIIIVAIVLLGFFIAFTTIDTSDVQSAQKIEISIWPCVIKDGEQVEMKIFEIDTLPYICGKILSEFLPLDLRYSLKNLENGEYVLFFKYRKFDTYEFNIKLPENLDVGNYEFEIKSGRRHIETLYFEVVQ